MGKYNFKMSPKILVTTGAGNVVKGGADVWTNHFLKEVWPKLPNKKYWLLLIDSKKPAEFEPSSLPKGLIYHHHYEDPSITDEWLNLSDKIHFLHAHYHHRPHIWKYEDKFDTIFVHAYAREMVEVINNIRDIELLQFNTKVDSDYFDDFLQGFHKRIWVGCNPTKMTENIPNFTFNIPNFYEFGPPKKPSQYCDNGEVGYTARIETRKLFHWMSSLKGYALVEQKDFYNLRDTTTFNFKNIKLYQWDPDIYVNFMNKKWGIFHGAHMKEPFGYNIFQAVDRGKIPIINKDWCVDLDYDYRASTINEFHIMVKQIKKDSVEKRTQNLTKIRNYLEQFDNKKEWVQKIIKSLTLDKYEYLDYENTLK